MQCRLCQNNCQKLCDSHIISEFLYTPLYDSKHRIFRVSAALGDKLKRIQKGLREQLLCETCEGRFSPLEGYARGVLFGGTEIEITRSEDRAFECRVDYKKFKLFQLSLLWRAGVSKTPEFENVRLGKHEKQLRKMLLANDPGKFDEYGCILFWPEKHREILDNLVWSIGPAEIDGVPFFRFIFGGMHWMFFLRREALTPGQSGLFLQEHGRLRILKGDGGNEPIENLAWDLHNSGQLRSAYKYITEDDDFPKSGTSQRVQRLQ